VEVGLVVPGDDLLDEVAGGGEVAALAEEERGPVPAPAPAPASRGGRALAGIEDGVEVAVDPVVVAVHGRRRNRGERGRVGVVVAATKGRWAGSDEKEKRTGRMEMGCGYLPPGLSLARSRPFIFGTDGRRRDWLVSRFLCVGIGDVYICVQIREGGKSKGVRARFS
jgi:hypothetical protein